MQRQPWSTAEHEGFVTFFCRLCDMIFPKIGTHRVCRITNVLERPSSAHSYGIMLRACLEILNKSL